MSERREIPSRFGNFIGNPYGAAACGIIIALALAAVFYLKPIDSAQAAVLEKSQVTTFTELLRTVQKFDSEIAAKELRLDQIEAGPLETKGAIAEYYAILSNLHWLRKERAITASSYNSSIRDLRDGSFPMEALSREGLPVRIR